MSVTATLFFLLSILYLPVSNAAQPNCDIVFSAGNAYADGVGDFAANLLMLQEIVKRIGSNKKYCLLISPEDEEIFHLRDRLVPNTRDINGVTETVGTRYQRERYRKIRNFLDLPEVESGVIRIGSLEIPWFTEEKANKVQLKGKVGVVASLFPEARGIAKFNPAFLKRFGAFVNEIVGSQDYGTSEGIAKSFSAANYSLGEFSGVLLPTGAEAGHYYFFDAFEKPALVTNDFEILVNANLDVRTVRLHEISDFLKLSFELAGERTVHIKYVTEKDKNVLSSTLSNNFSQTNFILEPAFPSRLSFFEFQKTLPRYEVVFSGGLTLGTMATSLGIPTFFQHLPFLESGMTGYREEISARLGIPETLNDYDLAKEIAKEGSTVARQKILSADKRSNIFYEVEKKVNLSLNDMRELPLSLKFIDPKTQDVEKIMSFLKKLGCN